MLNNIIVDEKLVVLDLQANSDQEAIEQLAQVLLSQEFVNPSFIDAIKERELNYSTGLPGTDFPIAIPHADSLHVKQDAIAIARLKEPVKFKMMGSEDVFLDTEMIFMLAIKNGNNQVMLLQALMDVFQEENALNELKEATNKKVLVNLFKNNIKGKEEE